MDPWVVWGIFAFVCLLLGLVGYHFTVRTLRFVTAAITLAVIGYVLQYGLMNKAPDSLVNSFAWGFDDLSSTFFHPLWPGNVVPIPGQTGWLVIIVLLAFAYRELEVWAMHWQPPAVDTSALGGDRQGTQKGARPGLQEMTDGQRHDKLAAELKFRLPAVEVRAPAILPGGTKPNGLASIVEDSGVKGSGLAGAIIRFFGMLWPNPRRYQVRLWVEPATEQIPACAKVTVDLEDTRTGGSMVTKTLVAPDPQYSASMIAGYVAQHIFRLDRTVPAWCVGSFDGDDLAAILVTAQQRTLPRSPDDTHQARLAQIGVLEQCRLDAGVARYELAGLLDLAGRHAQALRLHALNREQYPRFYRGMYRFGMSLEMIANPDFKLAADEVVALSESLDILDRCAPEPGVAEWRRTPGTLPPALRTRLLKAAQKDLCVVRHQLRLRSVIWAALWHRDERAAMMAYWRPRHRQRFHDGACMAELLAIVRQALIDEERGQSAHRRRRVGKALQVAIAITGGNAEIKTLLKPNRRTANEAEPGRRPAVTPVPRPGPKANRARWWPTQHRTPSWQAAYNLACVYAALEQRRGYSLQDRDELVRRAVLSLTRAVRDRECEMERPSDWISTDPDFSCLRYSPRFRSFLCDQVLQDYPAVGRTCIFCRRTGADIKITCELMVPRWIGEVLPSAEPLEVLCERSARCDPPPGTASACPVAEPGGRTVWAVCIPCYDGWMAHLEAEVRPILAPVINGEDKEPTCDQLAMVEAWVAMKAAIFAYAWTDTSVLTATDCENIMTHYQSPSGVQVLLRSSGSKDHPLRALGRVDDSGDLGGQEFGLTLTLGGLTAQVTAVRPGQRAASMPGADAGPRRARPEADRRAEAAAAG